MLARYSGGAAPALHRLPCPALVISCHRPAVGDNSKLPRQSGLGKRLRERGRLRFEIGAFGIGRLRFDAQHVAGERFPLFRHVVDAELDVGWLVEKVCTATADRAYREAIAPAYRAYQEARAPADRAAVGEVMIRLSQLIADVGEIAELDINPLLVLESGRGAIALDGRATLTR